MIAMFYFPIRSYCAAVDAIRELKADVVYPYGQGMFQRQADADDEVVSMFLSNDFNFDILDKSSRVHTSDWMGTILQTLCVCGGGMENENFVACAPEDKERFYRFTTMGYNVSRINDFVYHLEHSRGQNSWFNNPHMNGNNSEWEKIQKMDTKALFEYYKKIKIISSSMEKNKSAFKLQGMPPIYYLNLDGQEDQQDLHGVSVQVLGH